MAQLRGDELRELPTMECILEMHEILSHWERAQDSPSRRRVLRHLNTLAWTLQFMLQDAQVDGQGNPIANQG